MIIPYLIASNPGQNCWDTSSLGSCFPQCQDEEQDIYFNIHPPSPQINVEIEVALAKLSSNLERVTHYSKR